MYSSEQARDRMYFMLDTIISKRRNGEAFQQDFLQSLLEKHSKEAVDGEDDKLTDRQIKDNILTLLIAGHDTTTAALTWLIKFLEENPEVLKQLRVLLLISRFTKYFSLLLNDLSIKLIVIVQEEHFEIRERRNGGETLAWSEVNNMRYTSKVSNPSCLCTVRFHVLYIGTNIVNINIQICIFYNIFI